MKNPLISVLVPIYKIDQYLGICIESLLNQTYKNLEIILVDDGSPDRCPEICDLYARKDSRIKVIHKPNGGLVSARKAGMLAATGDYIGYVDGDDWVGQGFYHALYSSISESGADIAIAGFSRDLFASTKNMLNAIPSGVYEGEALDGIKKQMISYGDFYCHGLTTYLWNKLFRREAILQYQLDMDERITIGEDAATTYNAIMGANKIVVTDNCAYHYRQREDSMLKTTLNYAEEYRKVKYLHDYMMKSLSVWPEEYHLQEQTRDLIVSTYIIRSGGTLGNNHPEFSNFPFSTDLTGKRIVVYGAGTFGQQFVKRLRNENKCQLVAWVDEDYWEYRRCCMDVDPIESICDNEYDNVVIANLTPTVIEKMKKNLYDYGVVQKKILTISTTKEQRDKALAIYLEESEK